MADQVEFWKKSSQDWFKEYCEWRNRAEKAERLVNNYLTPSQIAKANHLADLEDKNRRLKSEVRNMQEKAEIFNRQLYATGLIVNCTGCLVGGPANPQDLTEEKVQIIEQLAKRIRTWWKNNQHRIPKDPA